MAKQKTLVNSETDKDVNAFIEAVPNQKRKADASTMLQVMKEITGKDPKIWGVGIFGYGKYSYRRKNGEEFEWINVGFSPAKTHLSVYVMYDINNEHALLGKLVRTSAAKVACASSALKT